MSAIRSVEARRRREFGDRPHDVDMREILERAHHVLVQRALAADMQDRAFRAEGGGDAGHRVRAARPRGRHDAAELAGLARIAVGRVGRHLLVAHIDDADALVDAAVIDVDDVAAAQREDGVDAFVLERFGDKVAARDDVRRRGSSACSVSSAVLRAAALGLPSGFSVIFCAAVVDMFARSPSWSRSGA